MSEGIYFKVGGQRARVGDPPGTRTPDPGVPATGFALVPRPMHPAALTTQPPSTPITPSPGHGPRPEPVEALLTALQSFGELFAEADAPSHEGAQAETGPGSRPPSQTSPIPRPPREG